MRVILVVVPGFIRGTTSESSHLCEMKKIVLIAAAAPFFIVDNASSQDIEGQAINKSSLTSLIDTARPSRSDKPFAARVKLEVVPDQYGVSPSKIDGHDCDNYRRRSGVQGMSRLG